MVNRLVASLTLGASFLRAHPWRRRPRRAESIGMPAVQLAEFWTAEMVRALPDDGRRYDAVMPAIERETLEWQSEGTSALWKISLEALFRPL